MQGARRILSNKLWSIKIHYGYDMSRFSAARRMLSHKHWNVSLYDVVWETPIFVELCGNVWVCILYMCLFWIYTARWIIKISLFINIYLLTIQFTVKNKNNILFTYLRQPKTQELMCNMANITAFPHFFTVSLSLYIYICAVNRFLPPSSFFICIFCILIDVNLKRFRSNFNITQR